MQEQRRRGIIASGKTRRKTREPLAEVIRKRRPNGFFTKMSDDELIEYAKKVMELKGIKDRMGLREEDAGLLSTLWKRRLTDKVGFQEQKRIWASMSDDELVGHAKKFMKENAISGRSELAKEARGLHQALSKRKLLDRLEFEEKRRDWVSMDDDELVGHAKKFMKEKRISGRTELSKADNGLYRALSKRKLLDRIDFEEKQRPNGFFKKISDEEIVSYAKKFMKEKGISGRTELQKADLVLYNTLRKRKLLDRIGFEEKRRPNGFFKKMSDDEFVEYTKGVMKEKGIRWKGELKGEDEGLYQTLCVRKLLDRIGFEEIRRKWSSFSDTELVEHASQFMEEKGISGRGELEKVDKGLYLVLLRRKLLDHVFADIEQSKERGEAQALFDGLQEFQG